MNCYLPDKHGRQGREAAFSLIEVMVSLFLLTISGLAISSAVIHSFKIAKFTEVNHIANALAMSKVEEIASLDTMEITTALNGTESSVTWPNLGLSFARMTTVVENPDGSKTLTIRVSSNSPPLTTVEFTTSFAVWE